MRVCVNGCKMQPKLKILTSLTHGLFHVKFTVIMYRGKIPQKTLSSFYYLQTWLYAVATRLIVNKGNKWKMSHFLQASVLLLVIWIFNPLMDVSTPSLHRASMSSPRVTIQESSRSPSRTHHVELWVSFNLHSFYFKKFFVFLFLFFKQTSFHLWKLQHNSST